MSVKGEDEPGAHRSGVWWSLALAPCGLVVVGAEYECDLVMIDLQGEYQGVKKEYAFLRRGNYMTPPKHQGSKIINI